MKKVSIASLTFLVLSIFLLETQLIQCQMGVSDKIQEANNAVLSAFTELSNAESSGANVTVLLEQMNNAVNLLAQAENAYKTGNNQLASDSATSALSIAQQILPEVQNAQNISVIQGQNAFMNTVFCAGICNFLVLLGLFFGWRLVKKHYVNKMLKSKPVVKDH
ncbi:MAG: hypothetical protein ACQCN3_02180 [Candidatus Bathyarchaeia archaeon]